MGQLTRSFTKGAAQDAKKKTYEDELFIFVSKTGDYANDLVVEVANSGSYDYVQHRPIRETIFGKKIASEDICPIIERNDWEANTIYRQFDGASNSLFTQSRKHFIYTSSRNVYKCIDNNDSAESTVEPTHTDESVRTESDGYVWKYMYTVPSNSKFITTSRIPIVANTAVRTNAVDNIEQILVLNRGNNYVEVVNGSVQATVSTKKFQIQAHTLEFSNGVIITPEDRFFNNTSILVFESGDRANGSLYTVSDYTATTRVVTIDGDYTSFSGATKYEITPRVRVVGDGSNATAIAVVSSTKTIEDIEMKSKGTGYSFANIIFDANTGSGASARAAVAPSKGHGHDPFEELNCDEYMIAVTVNGTESNTITSNIPNGFRTVGIVKNPSKKNEDYLGTVSTVAGQSLVTGSGTAFDNVFAAANTANVVATTLAAVNTAILSNTAIANSTKADTLFELLNEHTKNLHNAGINFDKILVEGEEFDEIQEVVRVTSNTSLNTKELFIKTQVAANYRRLFTANTFDNVVRLNTSGATGFSNGEVVSTANLSHYGTVINIDGNTVNITGTRFPNTAVITGQSSGAVATVTSVSYSNSWVDLHYGDVVYIKNIDAVTKTANNEVDFKIVIKV